MSKMDNNPQPQRKDSDKEISLYDKNSLKPSFELATGQGGSFNIEATKKNQVLATSAGGSFAVEGQVKEEEDLLQPGTERVAGSSSNFDGFDKSEASVNQKEPIPFGGESVTNASAATVPKVEEKVEEKVKDAYKPEGRGFGLNSQVKRFESQSFRIERAEGCGSQKAK